MADSSDIRLGIAFPGSRTVSYGYDDASRRTTIGYPSSLGTVTYGYDSVNRLATVTDWNSKPPPTRMMTPTG